MGAAAPDAAVLDLLDRGGRVVVQPELVVVAAAARGDRAGGHLQRGFEDREELLAEGEGGVEVGFHEGAEADEAVG